MGFGQAQGAATGSGDLLSTNNLSDVDTAATALANLGGLPLAGGTMTGDIAMDTVDITTDGTTGTEIGTAITQKIGFWGVTPVVQHSATGDETGFAAGAGTSWRSDSTGTGTTGASAYTVGDIITALKLCGIMAQ